MFLFVLESFLEVVDLENIPIHIKFINVESHI